MKREFLKELGLTDEAINSVMQEYGKSVNALKAQNEAYKNQEDELNQTKKQLDKMQEDLKQLEASESTIEELKSKIKAKDEEFNTFKADTEKREIQRRKTSALSKVLKEAGAIEESIDLLIPVFDIDAVQIDKNGNIIDKDDLINPIKESKKGLFVTRDLENNTPPTSNNQSSDDLDDQAFFNTMMKKGN